VVSVSIVTDSYAITLLPMRSATLRGTPELLSP